MKSYVQIEGLTKSYGDRLLFGDVTLGVYEGDKIGIIAKNGAGKGAVFACILYCKFDFSAGVLILIIAHSRCIQHASGRSC